MSTDDLYRFAMIEAVAKKYHSIFQVEAKRQGIDDLPDDYNSLPENVKEFNRALAKYTVDKIEDLVEAVQFYANEDNWVDVDNPLLLDGKIYDDMGKKAREILKELGIDKRK